MVGARDIAVPAAARLSYWMFLFGGIFLYVDLPLDTGAGRRLVHLCAARRAASSRPGKRATVWAQLITFTEVSALAVAVELIVDHLQAARARHVAQPHAAVRLGDAGHVASW